MESHLLAMFHNLMLYFSNQLHDLLTVLFRAPLTLFISVNSIYILLQDLLSSPLKHFFESFFITSHDCLLSLNILQIFCLLHLHPLMQT